MCASEMGKCRSQWQVQITHEKRVHPYQLWDLPSWERLLISPRFNQGKCFCSAAPSAVTIYYLMAQSMLYSILLKISVSLSFVYKLLLHCDRDIKHLIVLLHHVKIRGTKLLTTAYIFHSLNSIHCLFPCQNTCAFAGSSRDKWITLQRINF